MDRCSLVLNVCYSWVWYSCAFMAAACALSWPKHGRQSLDFAELPVTKFQGDNKELHTTSWRAYFAKVNPFSCFLKGIKAKNTLVLATAPVPQPTSHQNGHVVGESAPLLPNPLSNRAPSSPPQELHIIPLLSIPIILSHCSLLLLYSVAPLQIQYICILIIFHNTEEENLCSCFRIVTAVL